MDSVVWRGEHCRGCGEPIYWEAIEERKRGMAMFVGKLHKIHFQTCSNSFDFARVATASYKPYTGKKKKEKEKGESES